MRSKNRQIVLRPQDLVVALKLVLLREQPYTYASLGADLALAASEVHSSIGRALLARLVTQSKSGGITPINAAIREFAIHGAKYSFPAVSGPTGSGMPTSYGAPIFKEKFSQGDSPVWPMIEGRARGPILYPLYPSLPIAAAKDSRLYDLLSMIDSIRAGAARERDYATTLISERLT